MDNSNELVTIRLKHITDSACPNHKNLILPQSLEQHGGEPLHYRTYGYAELSHSAAFAIFPLYHQSSPHLPVNHTEGWILQLLLLNNHFWWQYYELVMSREDPYLLRWQEAHIDLMRQRAIGRMNVASAGFLFCRICPSSLLKLVLPC